MQHISDHLFGAHSLHCGTPLDRRYQFLWVDSLCPSFKRSLKFDILAPCQWGTHPDIHPVKLITIVIKLNNSILDGPLKTL